MENTDVLITHLSKEIELITNNAMIFRTRVAFTVLIGPYILLSSVFYATKGDIITLGEMTKTYSLAATVAYIVLGFVGGGIEWAESNRCNELRKCVLALCPADSKEKTAALQQNYNGLKIFFVYAIAFMLIGTSFYNVVKIATTMEIKRTSEVQQPKRPSTSQLAAPTKANSVP